MKIGIVIPAHNEEEYLNACLQAVQNAIIQLNHVVIDVVVVLDNCSDQSLSIVKDNHMNWLVCNYGCVGQARDLGIRHLIAQGATWIACTDADSCVDLDWLKCQMYHLPTDAICGTVSLDNMNHLSVSTQRRYSEHYQDRMGHQHIHGANLSFSAQVYTEVGGFEPISCHEEVSFIQKLILKKYTIVWSNLVRVTTSSRLTARAPQGLSHFLIQLEKLTDPI